MCPDRGAEPAVYALVLAAGAGRRFGGDKLLATFQGTPLVGHVAATVAQAIHGGIVAGGVAVIRPGATTLAWPLDGAGLELVENLEAASGLASSLQAGLTALAAPREPPAGAALVILADQPLLRLPVLAALVRAWHARPGTIRPRYLDRPEEPGHPVLVDRAGWPRAAELRGDEGLGRLLADDPTVRVIDVPGANPDVDTPDDLRLLEDTY